MPRVPDGLTIRQLPCESTRTKGTAAHIPDNGFVESLNGRFRDECLNEHMFRNLPSARRLIEEWRTDYNNHRPHTSLGGLTPNEFATRSRKGQNEHRVQL